MSGILKTGGDGKAMLSFSGERTSWKLFRKQLRSSCDQNGMGWTITVGHVMNQFLIHIEANNTAAAAVAKKDIPVNFEDFDTVDGMVFENMIETSGALLTGKLDMIKSRTASLGTNFSDYTKMCLVSEEDLDELIEATDKWVMTPLSASKLDDLAAKAEAMVKEAVDILAKRKTSHKVNDPEVKSYSTGCVANKDDKEYVSCSSVVLPIHASPTTKLTSPSSIVIYHGHLSPTQIATKKYEESVSCSAILDQKFVPGTIIDSAAMMNVVENTSRQELAGGKRVNILGVTGGTASVQVADVVFSIKTKTKKPHVLATKGTTLVLDKTKDNILSLAVLLQSGFKVDFSIGTVDDPSFGGVLTTSTGARATLLFEDNLWRVPMAFLSTMTDSTSQAHISDEQNIQASPITIPEISLKIASGVDRQSTCTSKDGKTDSTIRRDGKTSIYGHSGLH
jgi:hypothetical protein